MIKNEVRTWKEQEPKYRKKEKYIVPDFHDTSIVFQKLPLHFGKKQYRIPEINTDSILKQVDSLVKEIKVRNIRFFGDDKIISMVINTLSDSISTKMENHTLLQLYGDSLRNTAENGVTYLRFQDNDDSVSVVITPVPVESKQIKKRQKKFVKAIEEIAVEFETQKISVPKRLKLGKIDDVLKNEIQHEGIKLNYNYAIINDEADSLVLRSSNADSTITKEAQYKLPIFTDETFGTPHSLLINFPDKKQHIIRSMSVMLMSSAFLTLFLIITFAVTIMSILRQKKISEIKSDFINNMTHEFKTPIATISLAVDSISNPKVLSDNKKVLYFAQKAKEENQRMNNLVESVLQMSLIDKKKLILNREEQDLDELVENAIEKMQLQAQQKQGEIIFEPATTNGQIKLDKIHFTNLVFNLLDNALKYSKDNPKIIVQTLDKNDGLVLSVKDNGIGMSKEEQAKVFDKFYRVSTGNIHNVKGFGLGLSYIKAIVDAHEGNISLKSEKGKGCTFEIWLPQQ